MDRDQAFGDIYEELRSVARVYMSRERAGSTLQPTALVNEVYIKLCKNSELVWKSKTHFLAIAARAMKQVLIESARRRSAQKRRGDNAHITLSSVVRAPTLPLDEFIDVHAALEKLAALEPHGARHAKLVEYVWLGGMELTEAAEHLNVSRRQAYRDWAFARTWLERELAR